MDMMRLDSSLGIAWLFNAAGIVGLSLGGCGGSSSPAACPAGGGAGQIVLTVDGPAGLTATVHLTGSGLATPMVLSPGAAVSVPAGAYQLVAKRGKIAAGAAELIGKASYASSVVFDGCVRAGAMSAATVKYAVEPGSGKLWTTPANGIAAIAAYDEVQLHLATSQAPGVTRTMGLTHVSDLAVDPAGNLWAADAGVGGGIVVYPMLTLGSAADRRPALKLTGVEKVRALAFDAEGNLWAAQSVPGAMDRVLKLAAAGLAFDAAATTTVMRAASPATIATSADLAGPADIAFDGAGNLWLTSQDNDAVIKLSATQLAAGGNVPAAVVLKARKTTGPVLFTYGTPIAVTFDRSGNLWVGFIQGPTRFTAAQLTASATIDDPLQIEPMGAGGAGVGEAPQAFDEQAGMWLPRASVGMPAALVRMAPAALMAGGPQAPALAMPSEGLGNGPGTLVFNPVPTQPIGP